MRTGVVTFHECSACGAGTEERAPATQDVREARARTETLPVGWLRVEPGSLSVSAPVVYNGVPSRSVRPVNVADATRRTVCSPACAIRVLGEQLAAQTTALAQLALEEAS